MAEKAPADGALDIAPGLNPEEDHELQSLDYLNAIGCLAEHKVERLVELRLRDRRDEVRPTRRSLEERQRAVAEMASPRLFGRRRG